mgnify:CR=1 FL=1
MSSHNPRVAQKAALSGYVEMILFSINPAFDMLPASENIDTLFADSYDASLRGIDADRALFYRTCEQNDVGITVMKGFAGGRLFDEKRSPFGIRLTPVQCIHYALTRPAVGSILCGYDTKEQLDEAVGYETASEAEKDYASVLANAPLHSYRGECTYCGHCKPCAMQLDIAMINKFYDLAAMQPEDYTSGFEARLQELYDQIAGREAFSYDPEEDEMYKRYARLYAAQGAAAMEDTMGQAAALTGGYGSSYAQAVGQQAYDRYLGELASLVPELRQAALAEYTQVGKALTDRYGLLRQQESAAYDRWQDTVAQWQKALAQAQSEYDDTAAQDAKSYQTMLKHYQDKAEQERKLSAGGAKLEESGYTADAGKESLSSMAAESLQRAVGNYLKSGREDAAQALWQQYAGRMTPVQRQRFEALFAGYGRSAGL